MGDGECVYRWMGDGESVGGWGMESVRVGGEVGEVRAIQHIVHSTIH